MESNIYTVSLNKLIEEFSLDTLYMPEPEEGEEIMVTRNDINRPGLALAGYFGYFEPARLQIIGRSESSFVMNLPRDKRIESYKEFLGKKPVAVIYTRNNESDGDFLELAKKNRVPVLRTEQHTTEFSAALIASLNLHLAPRITRHGVLVEVYGEGMLILGDSGVGKSETAIELVKRGHRLIADDAVEIKKVSSKTLVGSAPEIIRHYVELRGIGIVNVKSLFGIGAVKDTEKIDLIINLEPWVQGKMYDRLGLESEYTDIMGIQIPTTTIPVKPGRNLAIILEIAAMNNRQKKMGINTAQEFNERLMNSMNEDM